MLPQYSPSARPSFIKGRRPCCQCHCCSITPVCNLLQKWQFVQAVQEQFWASQGQVSVTEAVGFVLVGQADAAAIADSLADYLRLLMLLGQYNSTDQQSQLLRVSQSALKQSAYIMRDSASFQAQLLEVLRQLVQVRRMPCLTHQLDK